MKAVFCFYGPNSLGGPTTWALRMLPRLRLRGIDAVGLCYQTKAGNCRVVADLRAGGVPVRVVPAEGRPPLDGMLMVLSLLEEERPSVLVADHVQPAFMAGEWIRCHGIPTVMVLRSDDEWYRDLCRMFLAGAEERRVTAVVAVSRELAETARAMAPPETEVLWCPSGTLLGPRRAAWRADRFHAVYIGRLEEEQKRIMELVHELIATSRAVPGFSATLYGDGSRRIDIEHILQTESGHRVAYGGLLAPDKVQERLCEAQALVLFSAYEGLSSAVQEAMACGLPVLSRHTASGTEGVVIHGETGWILEADDALPDAVKALMGSKPLWQQLSAGGRALAERDFDIEKAADRWIRLLRRLGEGKEWPAGSPRDMADWQAAYFEYLSGKPALEIFEAEMLIDRARRNGRGLQRFFSETTHDLATRQVLLYRAIYNGVFAADAAASCVRQLAEEAEFPSVEMRYRIASLWQMVGDYARARVGFNELARHAADRKLRAGSLFHLAQLAAGEGKPAEAATLARACLALEPSHRAAAAMLPELPDEPEFIP
jgi:colanic acid/amylovoran biosynthesis glycosyltransferase